MFQNRYAAATTQLQDLIKAHPQDAKDHAVYALVLNYETKQKAALDEAKKAQSIAPHDGFVLTILTRVEDWNDDVQSAARDGAAAVKAVPDSTLAHVFYGEALADVGQYADAQTQLKKGADLAKKGSDYDKAEVDRNWAKRGKLQAQSAAMRTNCSGVWAINSFKPRLLSWLSPARPTAVCPTSVITGTPIQ